MIEFWLCGWPSRYVLSPTQGSSSPIRHLSTIDPRWALTYRGVDPAPSSGPPYGGPPLVDLTGGVIAAIGPDGASRSRRPDPSKRNPTCAALSVPPKSPWVHLPSVIEFALWSTVMRPVGQAVLKEKLPGDGFFRVPFSILLPSAGPIKWLCRCSYLTGHLPSVERAVCKSRSDRGSAFIPNPHPPGRRSGEPKPKRPRLLVPMGSVDDWPLAKNFIRFRGVSPGR